MIMDRHYNIEVELGISLNILCVWDHAYRYAVRV